MTAAAPRRQRPKSYSHELRKSHYRREHALETPSLTAIDVYWAMEESLTSGYFDGVSGQYPADPWWGALRADGAVADLCQELTV